MDRGTPRASDRKLDLIDDIVRTTRFYRAQGGWFFKTREGISMGPYAEQFDAEVSASLLIAQLAQLNADADPRATIQRFKASPANAPLVSGTQSSDQDQSADRQQPASADVDQHKRSKSGRRRRFSSWFSSSKAS